MTLALLERARRALLYLEENPGTKAVLSGGKGDGENISEAEAMYRYLTGHGIDGDRLLVEQMNEMKKRKPAPLQKPIHKKITPVLIRRQTTGE